MDQLHTFAASGYDIAAIHLFEGAARQQVAALIADCPVKRVCAREVVHDGPHKGGCLYVVLQGALDVLHTDARDIRMDNVITKVLPGECVGELSVLDGEATPDRIVARVDSDLLVIEADVLWKLIDESNGIARNLLRLLSFRIRAANAQLRRRQKVGEFYRQLSMVDGLTGLQNRAWLNDNLPTMIENAHTVNSPLSVIMVDLDHFKQFNDVHGHVSGDHALQVAARVISAGLRPSDFAARFGGEELIVILPATHQKSALLVAQRLCERLRQAVVFSTASRPLPHITASFGVATLEPEQNAEALISAADAALYRAKQDGRDRVAL
ncbi:MAG TPA: GGDEF domain-containing protein [Noviherbaspirillum sp.]|uniref:GGDEF domain-containing protein n=1 Tax=Noviherbaspirillum sp. TaxID=1926288 RepID=UPI002D6987A4|nr:GGDEF domain-containing protein [Noviherbaspirillum sp.]HYD94830.1 GGDEF domain-containing protein [Noviherbaspirillum sp.]